MGESERQHAWDEVHEPTTSAQRLGEIAGAYPEFGDAVLRHPNIHPQLAGWIRGTPRPVPVHDPVPGAGQPPPRFRRLALGWIAAGTVVALLLAAAGVVWGVLASGDAAKAEADTAAERLITGLALQSCSPVLESTTENFRERVLGPDACTVIEGSAAIFEARTWLAEQEGRELGALWEVSERDMRSVSFSTTSVVVEGSTARVEKRASIGDDSFTTSFVLVNAEGRWLVDEAYERSPAGEPNWWPYW